MLVERQRTFQKERRDTLLERWKTTRKDAIIPVNDDVLKTLSSWTESS